MSMHPNRNLFKEFPNRVFVETGSYRGDACALALEAGFKRIVSIDIDQDNIHFCCNRFDLYNNGREDMRFWSGDSAYWLGSMIEEFNESITFWLDSHWQMFEGTDPGPNPFPLHQELMQIMKHPIKTHTILIDDMLIMQKNIVGYDKHDIESWLRYINPDYKLDYFANPVVNSILVAHE